MKCYVPVKMIIPNVELNIIVNLMQILIKMSLVAFLFMKSINNELRTDNSESDRS